MNKIEYCAASGKSSFYCSLPVLVAFGLPVHVVAGLSLFDISSRLHQYESVLKKK